jgi:hypothetical protein
MFGKYGLAMCSKHSRLALSDGLRRTVSLQLKRPGDGEAVYVCVSLHTTLPAHLSAGMFVGLSELTRERLERGHAGAVWRLFKRFLSKFYNKLRVGDAALAL